MRPVVVLAYHATDVWRTQPDLRRSLTAHVENSSDHRAFDVRVSDLALDDRTRLTFAPIATLSPWEHARLIANGSDLSLTQHISRFVVRHALTGAPHVRAWPLRIVYRDAAGARFVTCWEIRVLSMPLEIGAVAVECASDESPEA